MIFVDDLPRNAMGKVQKAALRERYRAIYGGSDPSLREKSLPRGEDPGWPAAR